MNLRKILLIARREYMTNFRRRSFLFTMFFVPLFTIVITVVVVAIAGSAETDMGNVKSIAIVDEAGLLTDSSGNVVVDPPAPFHLIDRATAASKLANNEIQGIYLIGQPYLARGEVNSISRESLPGGVQIALEDYLKAAIAAKAGDPAITARLADPIAKHQIFRTDRPGVPVDEWALIGELLLPFGFGFIVFTATMTTSQFLMSGVAEEKENRMMELLATSVRPGEMLWGKILGLGALGLSQLVIWAAIGLVFAYTRSGIDIGRVLADLSITPTFLALLVSYFILSYLLTGAFMATLGVIGDNEQEGRQLATLITLPSILPFVLMFTFISDPGGTVPVVLSLFPITAPLSMIFRLVWGIVPPEQIAVSLALMVLGVLLAVWLAARIFRLGMLSYGKRLSLREIIAALREGRDSIVTTSAAAGNVRGG